MTTRTRSLTIRRLYWLAAAVALLMTFVATGSAQSTDAEAPTPMTSNTVSGKSNGKAKTIYYSFTATAADPGEVKVKVTASTDERSTNLRVNFLDEDGQKVMDEIYVIPNRDPAVKVGKHTFAERQKVIMRITLPNDPQVNLLNYKIEVSGAVEFEAAPDTPTTTDPTTTPPTESDPTSPAPDPSTQSSDATQQSDAQVQNKTNVKQKVKEGAKKTGKDLLKNLLKDKPF